jgi:hypothetical protein
LVAVDEGEFLERLRAVLKDHRAIRTRLRAVRMSGTTLQRIEFEHGAVEHHDGQRWIDNVLIEVDDELPLGAYALDRAA